MVYQALRNWSDNFISSSEAAAVEEYEDRLFGFGGWRCVDIEGLSGMRAIWEGLAGNGENGSFVGNEERGKSFEGWPNDFRNGGTIELGYLVHF